MNKSVCRHNYLLPYICVQWRPTRVSRKPAIVDQVNSVMRKMKERYYSLTILRPSKESVSNTIVLAGSENEWPITLHMVYMTIRLPMIHVSEQYFFTNYFSISPNTVTACITRQVFQFERSELLYLTINTVTPCGFGCLLLDF